MAIDIHKRIRDSKKMRVKISNKEMAYWYERVGNHFRAGPGDVLKMSLYDISRTYIEVVEEQQKEKEKIRLTFDKAAVEGGDISVDIEGSEFQWSSLIWKP